MQKNFRMSEQLSDKLAELKTMIGAQSESDVIRILIHSRYDKELELKREINE